MTRSPRPPIILASGSPRRRDLLATLGLPFTVLTSGVAEDADPALDPAALARHLARQKAEAVAATLAEGLVIGADTIVALGETILGKPRDADDARQMLRRLRGQRHRVISGLAVIDAAGGQSAVSAVTTRIASCYTNVVGFPLCEVAALLGRFGVVIDAPPPVCALADGSPCPRL